jgi:hypothetical protein
MRPFFMGASHNFGSMASLSTSPQLQRFIDDEMARAPLLIDEVLQGLVDAPLRFPTGANTFERQRVLDQREALQRARPFMVRAFTQALRRQVEAPGSAPPAVESRRLSLVEEDEVATDVEVQRAAVIIASTAEYELRELGSYTSALVGDVHVAHDTNPLRPEAYAQALLAAMLACPRPQAEQLVMMRQAAAPFAQLLRKAYAAAAGRLEDQGVNPGVHRTIVLPPNASVRSSAPPADLNALRDSMPVPLDVELQPVEARPARPSPAPSRIDQQLIELLTRLFDAILGDPSLTPEVQRLLGRLQTSAVRVALRDPDMLDSYGHPVWEFIDRLAFEAGRNASESEPREQLLRYAQGLIEHIVREPTQDAALYRWGLGRFDAFTEHQLAHYCAQAQQQIDGLRTLAMSRSAPAPLAGTEPALDVGNLETVPAELIDLPSSPHADHPLPALKPGEWLHLYLQGQWRELQLLWTDGRGEAWLFRQPGGRTWALRRAALERLNEGGLAEPLDPPSLVQHAAQQVLRQIPAA